MRGDEGRVSLLDFCLLGVWGALVVSRFCVAPCVLLGCWSLELLVGLLPLLFHSMLLLRLVLLRLLLLVLVLVSGVAVVAIPVVARVVVSAVVVDTCSCCCRCLLLLVVVRVLV